MTQRSRHVCRVLELLGRSTVVALLGARQVGKTTLARSLAAKTEGPGTHAGAELDLLVVRGRTRLGFEVKRTTSPAVTRSMRSALESLRLDGIDLVHAGEETFALSEQVRAVAARRLLVDLPPLDRA